MGKPSGLAKEQLSALDRLKRVRALRGFYLAGGSAIAFHLGHRRSLDLHLFSESDDADLRTVQRSLERTHAGGEVVGASDVTLKLKLLGEAVDIVRYPYPPLEKPMPGPAGFPVAGLLDLAAMKLVAIGRRGIRRDFWDLHAIVDSGTTLPQAGAAYVARYGLKESDLYFVARALTYFEDAEKDPAFPEGLTKAKWRAIKTFFLRAAPSLVSS